MLRHAINAIGTAIGTAIQKPIQTIIICKQIVFNHIQNQISCLFTF